MADIAAVFHWPLSDLEPLSLSELMNWRALAIDRFRAMQPREAD
ncbi:GpE family phage tail protein [Novosphingopyxis sp. YJ-S2-01]|nr:GpE family phage tail protein [Novosphingopyxis sp. YJ-S2-01]MBH9537910.1 GpE family phage tail protein [Novosphingopyxis sp. YJ-S2-01]